MTALLVALVLGAGPSGQIAFVLSTEQEDQCVCVLEVGTGAVVRAGAGDRDGAPQWSPDGEWLAFASKQPDGMGIRVVRADGSEGRLLRHKRLWNRYPRWAPEGRRLAYSSSEEMAPAQVIAVYNLETDTETEWANARQGLLRPVWVPTLAMMQVSGEEELREGGAVNDAFLEEAHATGVILALGLVRGPGKGGASDTEPSGKGRGGSAGRFSTEIFILTRTQVFPLVSRDPERWVRYAEWGIESNPRGTHFAFESNDGGDREIFVLGKTGIADVSNHRAADWNPVWSSESGWLAFESFRGGRRGIYRVYVDTCRVFPVAASASYDCWAPAWSPDGEWIAFVSGQTGTAELYCCDKAGGHVRQLTKHPELRHGAGGGAFAPAWRPEKRR